MLLNRDLSAESVVIDATQFNKLVFAVENSGTQVIEISADATNWLPHIASVMEVAYEFNPCHSFYRITQSVTPARWVIEGVKEIS